LSGAATGGLLAARAGLKAAGKNALVGGVILAAIEVGYYALTHRGLVPGIERDRSALLWRSLEKSIQMTL
jgi:hypothetical protein